MAKFKRILLKLSGESLMGKQSFGIDPERLSDYAKQIKEVHETAVCRLTISASIARGRLQ